MSVVTIQTLLLIFYNIILYYINTQRKQNPYAPSLRVDLMFLIIAVICGVIGTQSGDYFHYEELFSTVGSGGSYNLIAIEPIYFWLADIVGYDYVKWRLVLYTFEYGLLFLFLRKTKFNTPQFYFFYTILCLNVSVVGRYYWGLFLYFFGVYLFFKEKRLIYIIPIILSFFAHKSLMLLVALFPLSFFKLNRKTLILSLVILPVLMTVVMRVTNGVMVESDNDYLAGAVARYEQYTDSSLFTTNFGFLGDSIGLLILNLTKYTATLMGFWIAIKALYIDRITVEKQINALMTIAMGIFIVIITFLFGDTQANTIVYRYLEILEFIVLFLMYYFSVNDSRIWAKYIKVLNLYLYYFELNFLYEIYCALHQ